MIIAIDGGAATGKTTIAKKLSKKINFIHLNSGLLYRGITYILLENDLLNKSDEFYIDFLKKIDFNITGNKYDIISYKNNDITCQLHNKNIADNIKYISNNIIIRKYITNLQREISTGINIVCEGRDIGTVVFPFADCKFFLKANIDIRVERRYKQYLKNNIKIDKQKIKQMLLDRDYNDTNRNISPLKKAKDSIVLNTSNKSIDEQIAIIVEKINKG